MAKKRERLMVTKEQRDGFMCRHPDGYYVYNRTTRRVCNMIYGRKNVHPATVTWEEPEKCEGCGKPAVGRDIEGVPLCAKCAKAAGN